MTDIGANCVRSDRKVVTSLGVLTWISLFLQRLSTAVLAKPFRPAKSQNMVAPTERNLDQANFPISQCARGAI